MRAGPLRTLSILARSVWVTLAITLPTLAEVYRGTYRRETGDARLRWWATKLLGFVRMRWTVVNPHGVALEAGRPTILMTNHASLYDIPLTFVALPGSIRMLTKKELFRVPIWGRGLHAGEFVSIDRHDRAQAIRDLDAGRRKMESGIVLWVAPEGTRSRNGRLGPFKKGGFMLALDIGATIVPIGIRGTRDALPPKTFAFHLGKTVEVHVGRPIDARAYSHETREALMTEVECQIRALAAL